MMSGTQLETKIETEKNVVYLIPPPFFVLLFKFLFFIWTDKKRHFLFLSSFELVWIFRRESETRGEKHVFLVCQFRKCFLFFFVRRDSVRQMKGKGNCFDPQTHRQVKVPSLLIACFPIFFFFLYFLLKKKQNKNGVDIPQLHKKMYNYNKKKAAGVHCIRELFSILMESEYQQKVKGAASTVTRVSWFYY